MSDPTLEQKLRSLAEQLGRDIDGHRARQDFAEGNMVVDINLRHLRQAARLGEERMRNECDKIVDEFMYLDGQAGELAHVLLKRIRAIKLSGEDV